MLQILRKLYGGWLHVYRTLIAYSRQSISPAGSHGYDTYWKERRGDRPRPLSAWQKSRADLVLGFIEGNGEVSIGDIGCGEGTILKYLKERSSTVTDVVGYDSSEKAREWASSIGVCALPLDLGDPTWQDSLESSDYLLLMEIIEHVPNSEEVVLAALDKCRRGIFITVPNTGFILHRFRLLFGSFPAQWVLMPNEHLRFWTLRDMRWWLRALGLKKSRVLGYNGVPLLNRMWPSLFAAGLFVSVEK